LTVPKEVEIIMKVFLVAAALILWGCLSSPEKSEQDAFFNGSYESSDSQVTVFIHYPNWRATYHAMSPSLIVSGNYVGVRYDTVFSTDLSLRKIAEYDLLLSGVVLDFHNLAPDGSILKADTSILVQLGFGLKLPGSGEGRYASEFRINEKLTIDDSVSPPHAIPNFLGKALIRE
jgi:hypothetical protein